MKDEAPSAAAGRVSEKDGDKATGGHLRAAATGEW